MLLLDKILFSPVGATIWAARQIQHAIQQEEAAEPERITADLSELYMMLDTGRIAEAEFAAREKALLDQLDRIEQRENDSHQAKKSQWR